MRILYSHYLREQEHPAVRMVDEVADGLRRLGHEVVVHASAAESADVPVTPPHAARPSVPKRLLWFAKELHRNCGTYRRDAAAVAAVRPDVVLCRQDAYRFSMPLACRRAGVPVVTYADAPVAYETRHFNPAGRWHPAGLVELVERWVLRHSRAVVTVSEPAAAILRRYHLPSPIAVAANGVDVGRFRPLTAAEREECRRALGVTTPHVAGFVGTFRPFHGGQLLADLIRRTARRSDLTWLLVGDGPGRGAVEEAARGLPRVVFAGRRPAAAVPGLLGSMDLLVCPHQHSVPEFYFCPLKVLEGMAAGVPCLASAQGDIPRLLGGGGRALRSDHPDVWAEAVTLLLDSPHERTVMGAAGRERALAHFTWGATATAVATVLGTVQRAARGAVAPAAA